jgi:hypothetical protein
MGDFIAKNLVILLLVFIAFAFAKLIIRTHRYVFLQKIAYASYCMYLFHRPVWWLMVDIYNPGNVEVKALYLALLGIPLTIFFSYYLQKFYDRYFERGSENFSHLADGTARQKPRSLSISKQILNISSRKPPGIHLLNQMFQKRGFCAYQRKHLGVIRLQGLSELRDLQFHPTLRCLHSLRLITAPITPMKLLLPASLIMASAQMISHLLLQGLLQKVLNPFVHQLRQNVFFSLDSFREQRRNLLSYLLRWWYSFHGMGSFLSRLHGMRFSLKPLKDTPCSFIFTGIL